jgi:4-aminobutyrate aminotransferase-like enzyme/Ser/Thr protein kinase RdoA (MazF antagonist)
MPQGSDIERLLTTPAPVISIQQAENIASEYFGLCGTTVELGSERDRNFHLVTKDGDQYVVKIANSAEDPAIIDMQLKALKHIARVDPTLPVPRVVLSKSGRMIEEVVAEDGRKHPARVLAYISGRVPDDETSGGDLYRQMGIHLARTAKALRGFFHPIANYEILWDIKHAANLRKYLDYVDDPVYIEQAKYFLDRFEKNVLPVIPQLRAQIVHNDLAPYNILVDETKHDEIVGIIDFGDLTHTSLVIDLATTIAASLREEGDPAEVAIQIVSGYNEITPLEDAELSVLFDLVGTRLMMLNVIATWRVSLHPENREYIIGGVESTWKALKLWMDQDPEKITKRFFRTCGIWEYESPKTTRGESIPLLISRRESLLGPFAYLFYEEPLHIVKGEGVWLYDRDNQRYLDAYNNVPQVGHSHPHVVNEIAEQAKLLNTSTRYLHEYVLSLAERITAKLPEPLSVCTFVCTGSEANELAWIMAKLISGNDGALITNYSYHGSTYAIGQLSTENLPEGSLPSHVRTFKAPTSNLVWSQKDTGIQAAIDDMDNEDLKPAMCIVDTSFVSDGIYTSPKGYLQHIFAETRSAGGLCVADEVQGGFGRLGMEFWGFEFDDVVPDIATLGKPMGNGHPIAAVVTTPAIAEVLANDRGYFNTFGGNPVSCAAGLAVLDVIEKEGLQENAFKVGEYLIEGLKDLQKEYSVLGQVHGSARRWFLKRSMRICCSRS